MTAAESALRGVADGSSTLQDLRNVLADANVFVPSPAATDDGDLQLPVVELQGGGSAVPLFSSYARLREAGGPEDAAQVPFDVLGRGWPDDVDAVLDPGFAWALRVPADAMQSTVSVDVPARTQMAWRHPAEGELPAQLLPALTEALATRPDVVAAWWLIVRFPDRPDDGERLLIAVQFTDSGDHDETINVVGSTIAPFLTELTIDLTAVDPTSSAAHVQTMLERPPIYLG